MNVVDASLRLVNVSAVSTSQCPFCKCDPCDCDWGLNELFKTWNTGVYKALVNGCLAVVTCPPSKIYDYQYLTVHIIHSGQVYQMSYSKHYQSAIIDRSIYKVGDLVNYHPFFGVCDFKKPWLIKTVFSNDPLDCSYHDYEITDGQQSHLVTFNELRKLEDK